MDGAQQRDAWFSDHVLPLEPALRSWLRRRQVDGLEIDDIVQETYSMLVALEVVDHIQSPTAYVFQTALSVISRHVRRGRIVRIEPMTDLGLQLGPRDELSPERRAVSREELERVTAIIAGLPNQCRRAFILKRLEGLSQRAVAERMGISESAVEKHIGRALRALARR